MQGLLLAIAAYSIWGFFPLYFSYLNDVFAIEIVAHRIIWSLVATLMISFLLRRLGQLSKAFDNKTLIGWLGLSAMLIAINWLVYIWAVSQHRVIETSLGYFITPVVSLLFARIFFKESLHPLQAWAAIIALTAIGWELLTLGQLPWISLVLAFAFALYGVVRKHCNIDGISGLTVETIWLLPFALAWITWQTVESQPTLAFGTSQSITLLLIFSGFLTALPLVLFAMAARRIDLSVVGFIMYINPTMQFLIGVFVLEETYPPQRMVTFVMIWFALFLFTIGLWKVRNRNVTHAENT